MFQKLFSRFGASTFATAYIAAIAATFCFANRATYAVNNKKCTSQIVCTVPLGTCGQDNRSGMTDCGELTCSPYCGPRVSYICVHENLSDCVSATNNCSEGPVPLPTCVLDPNLGCACIGAPVISVPCPTFPRCDPY